MNQLEGIAFLEDRLMMGPDGTVYALSTGRLQVPPSDDPSSAMAPSLSRSSSEGGQGAARFRYSAEAPRRGSGEPPVCFKYSAEAPHADTGNPPICFKFSAEAPRRDTGDPPICFAY